LFVLNAFLHSYNVLYHYSLRFGFVRSVICLRSWPFLLRMRDFCRQGLAKMQQTRLEKGEAGRWNTQEQGELQLALLRSEG